MLPQVQSEAPIVEQPPEQPPEQPVEPQWQPDVLTAYIMHEADEPREDLIIYRFDCADADEYYDMLSRCKATVFLYNRDYPETPRMVIGGGVS